MAEDPLTRFNSSTNDLKCQLLRLSCVMTTEMKQVEGGVDLFDLYQLFEPGAREPTLLPYTDDQNYEDFFILNSLIEGAQSRLKDSFRYDNVIGMTVYDENYEELVASMRGVLARGSRQNLDLARTLVVIVADGCDVLNQEKEAKQELTKKLAELGLYDKQRVKSLRRHWDTHGRPKDEVCFVFESDLALERPADNDSGMVERCCWQSYDRPSNSLVRANGNQESPHVTTLFVVKPYNRKKLHSHLWLMYGFCIFVNPLLVFLVDIGTEATPGSLAALDSYMCRHPFAGGCCGEIIVKEWCPSDASWIDVVALMGQWFEYKMGHILNKPLEDIMGYIGVLPGAFSCYRWDALSARDYQVLGQYFRPFIAPHTLPWKLSNIYHLAEDRIMSEEIIKLKHKRPFFDINSSGTLQQVGKSRIKTGYTLGFVKKAKALTEGAQSLVMLIKQRRRWINGGWFAMIKMVLGGSTLSEIRTSGHSTARKFWLLVELLYLFVVISFTWIAVGAYYLGFSMAMMRIVQKVEAIANLYIVLRYVYVLHIVMIFVMALSMKPESCQRLWQYFTVVFAGVSYFLFTTIAYLILTDGYDKPWVKYLLIGVLGVMAIAVFLYGEEYLKIAVASIAYTAMMPTYINILSIYAVCKTDDISWGTRGAEASSSQSNTEKSFSRLKTWYLLFYVTCNVLFGASFENVNRSSNDEANSWNTSASRTLQILYGVGLAVLLFPFFALLAYLFLRCLRRFRRSYRGEFGHLRISLRTEREYMLKNENRMRRNTLKVKLRTLLQQQDADSTVSSFPNFDPVNADYSALYEFPGASPDIIIKYRD